MYKFFFFNITNLVVTVPKQMRRNWNKRCSVFSLSWSMSSVKVIIHWFILLKQNNYLILCWSFLFSSWFCCWLCQQKWRFFSQLKNWRKWRWRLCKCPWFGTYLEQVAKFFKIKPITDLRPHLDMNIVHFLEEHEVILF